MSIVEVWLIAISLAMDCFAVSIASGILLKQVRPKPMIKMAFCFGLFQALMPLIGWIKPIASVIGLNRLTIG